MVTDEERATKDATAREKRGEDLIEGRSVTVAAGGIVIPKVASGTINGTFVQVSSLLDGVDQLPLMVVKLSASHMKKRRQTARIRMKVVHHLIPMCSLVMRISIKTKVTAYSEITNEIKNSRQLIMKELSCRGLPGQLVKSWRRKFLPGTGAAGHLVGILTTVATAIDVKTDLSIASITNTTLNEIIFSYGGDEA